MIYSNKFHQTLKNTWSMKMKMNKSISLMKLTIRLLISMIFAVILFMVLGILYSSRYWPDVYNYINANITIKRIPTISEIDFTIYDIEGTTEYFTTADDYRDASTVDGLNIDIDNFNKYDRNDDDEGKPNTKKTKRYALEDFAKDYSEVPKKPVVIDYVFIEDPTTIHEDVFVTKIVKDLISDSKLVSKNYGDVEIMTSLNEVNSEKMTSENSTDLSAVFPWITTIFIKNDSKSNQFEYFCDGALLNERALVTAARCLMQGNSTVDPDSILVILGKRSLLSMVYMEQAVKIKQVITHENFTNEDGKIENDLALLLFENAVAFNEIIQPAVVGNDTEEVDKSYTTAWSLQGDLVPVELENTKTQSCKSEIVGEDMFCTTYGLNVALCPSYGGIFAGFQSTWQLYGIRSGDTSDRGLCFSKEVWFTDLRAYGDWIVDNIE